MKQATLRTYYDLSGGAAFIEQEAHAIPGAAPYRLALDQLPQGKAGITALSENAYDADDIGLLLTVEVNDGTDASPDWTARTPTDSASPTASQVYVQFADYPWSPQLGFHAADAGKACRVSYTGWGTPLFSGYLTQVQAQLGILDAWKPLRVYPLSVYNRGWFDGRGQDGTAIYAAGSGFLLEFAALTASWAGGLLNFGAGGNCEATAFTTAEYWRRIGIYLIISDGNFAIAMADGAEAATMGGVTNPTPPGQDYFLLGYVDVQDNGNQTAGSIEPITAAAVSSAFVGARSSSVQQRSTICLTFQTFGALAAGAILDTDKFPGVAFQIERATLLLSDTGSGSTALRVDIQVKETTTWVSLFATNANKPTVAGNSGDDQTDSTPASDMSFAGMSSGSNQIAATARYRAYIEQGSADMQHATLLLWGYPL